MGVSPGNIEAHYATRALAQRQSRPNAPAADGLTRPAPGSRLPAAAGMSGSTPLRSPQTHVQRQ